MTDVRIPRARLVRAGCPGLAFLGAGIGHGAGGGKGHHPLRTILGTSLTVVAPTGQFVPDRLINLGTNRWAFKPEFAVSQPIGERWLLDVYAARWLFTANDSYYPGTLTRTQEPMGAFQAHLSYNFTRKA